MAMALLLEYMEEWLRAKNAVLQDDNACGVQQDALPQLDAGPVFVAINDLGVETGPDSTDSLLEIFNVEVGIWIRPEHLSVTGGFGELKLPDDEYLVAAYTLHKLERAVLVHKTGDSNKNGFHANYAFLAALNARYTLPHEERGAKFTTPLFYRGRTRMDVLTLGDGSDSPNSWFGYRLRFRGCRREQKLRAANDAIG
jgi:hypothetical protein